MAVGRIITRAVEAAKSGDADSYLWDDEVKGFGLKTTPGGHKVYLVHYRLGGRAGRLRRVTIGKHGAPWTPESACTEAKVILGDVAQGIDVAATRAAQRQVAAEATTMAGLAARFLTEHAEAKRKDRTFREYRRLLDLVRSPKGKSDRDLPCGNPHGCEWQDAHH